MECFLYLSSLIYFLRLKKNNCGLSGIMKRTQLVDDGCFLPTLLFKLQCICCHSPRDIFIFVVLWLALIAVCLLSQSRPNVIGLPSFYSSLMNMYIC